MTKEGLINLDFADVRAIMSEMGKAMMGTGEASGERRAIEAAEAAISNPLLDDVSMRGARGLLISICGGPDLTLYEVDEAATRIREEVDPEANIILGATFDDALEGTMRVSVVATGLAVEAKAELSNDEREEASGNVFGYTGQQPQAPKILKPAPMVARAPIPAPTPAHHEENQVEYYEEVAEAVAPQPVAARAAPQHRIPAIDQFPALAQKQVAAQQGRIESIAEHAAKRKKGLFERLADVGLGRREEPAQQQYAAPKRAEPKMQPQARMALPEPEVQAEASYDDDQLAIPAFLRRQAN
jgi:cell division protein FtsZ